MQWADSAAAMCAANGVWAVQHRPNNRSCVAGSKVIGATLGLGGILIENFYCLGGNMRRTIDGGLRLVRNLFCFCVFY